jgi:hypothetical protein
MLTLPVAVFSMKVDPVDEDFSSSCCHVIPASVLFTLPSPLSVMFTPVRSDSAVNAAFNVSNV